MLCQLLCVYIWNVDILHVIVEYIHLRPFRSGLLLFMRIVLRTVENGFILLIFKWRKIWNIHFVWNLILSSSYVSRY